MVDVELGWTDTQTGPYVDPEGCYQELQAIVAAINDRKQIIGALKGALDILEAIAKVLESTVDISPSNVRRQISRIMDIIEPEKPNAERA